jgi:hypothetical protein
MYWERGRDVSAMSRSSRRRNGRRGGSRSTALATGRTAATRLTAVPDGERQLSEGLLVEASVVARLFRVRLLSIDASLIISPARVTGRAPPPTRGAPPRRRIGAGLAAAERSLNEERGRIRR